MVTTQVDTSVDTGDISTMGTGRVSVGGAGSQLARTLACSVAAIKCRLADRNEDLKTTRELSDLLQAKVMEDPVKGVEDNKKLRELLRRCQTLEGKCRKYARHLKRLGDVSVQDSGQMEVTACAKSLLGDAVDNVHDTHPSTASLKSVIQEHTNVLNEEVQTIQDIAGHSAGSAGSASPGAQLDGLSYKEREDVLDEEYQSVHSLLNKDDRDVTAGETPAVTHRPTPAEPPRLAA